MFKDKFSFPIEIYADGADFNSFLELNKLHYIKGFTTNPSLLKKSGVKNYKLFAKDLLKVIDKPISFEVFADEPKEIITQAKEINSWGKNVFVKVPIVNTQNKSLVDVVVHLLENNIKCNITAIFTIDKIIDLYKIAKNTKTEVIFSIFSGRIADTGVDPSRIISKAVKITKKNKNIKILWASTREVFNIYQASQSKCHIITVPTDLLKKFNLINKDLNEFSLETVKDFYRDAQLSGLKI
jgi:transaldolase